MLITDQIQHMFEEPTKPADTTGGQPLRESAGERERQPLAPGQVYNLRAALAFSDAPSLTPRRFLTGQRQNYSSGWHGPDPT